MTVRGGSFERRGKAGSLFLLALGLIAQLPRTSEDCAGKYNLHRYGAVPALDGLEFVIQTLERACKFVAADTGIICQISGHLLYVNLQRDLRQAHPRCADDVFVTGKHRCFCVGQ